MKTNNQVRVRVPASSANLGPGYDSFGLALDLWDDVAARRLDRGLSITIEGVGANAVPHNESHLVVQAAHRAFSAMNEPTPGLELHCKNRIPHGGGLGSSAAAIVSGILLARALTDDGTKRLSDDEVFSLATDMEGHPDNVAPALYGGFTVSWMSDTPGVTDELDSEHPESLMGQGTAHGTAHCVRLTPHIDVAAVIFTAEASFSTRTARAALPQSIPHADAAANTARAALLVHALSNAPEHLFEGTKDWLHQDYRAAVMPQAAALLDRLRRSGIAAVLSGAGPSILALEHSQQRVSSAALAVPHAGYQAHEVQLSALGAAVEHVTDSGVADS